MLGADTPDSTAEQVAPDRHDAARTSMGSPRRSNAYLNYLLQAAPDLQGSANSIWANANLRVASSSSSGLSVAEFDVGGFFAPHMATSLNTSLARLAIDVRNPPSE